VVEEIRGATGLTVLVVDDEPDIRHILTRMLEAAGYQVMRATHGGAALGQARSAPPDLVITDRMMPVMGGLELITALRRDQRTVTIPIVLLTGTAGERGGADAMLMKPFCRRELIEIVDRLAGRTA
jgi:CheY-like chemotaxis protein